MNREITAYIEKVNSIDSEQFEDVPTRFASNGNGNSSMFDHFCPNMAEKSSVCLFYRAVQKFNTTINNIVYLWK